MGRITKHILYFLLTLTLFSCAKEQEWDYDYYIVNDMDSDVTLTYKVVSSPAEYTMTFPAGYNTLMASRYGVVGHDIWNIESASLIYMFDKLDGFTSDEVFADNLRLRSAWKGPQTINGRGVYTLHLTRDLFNTTLKKYEYRITNSSDKYTFQFAYKGTEEQQGAMAVRSGETAYICTYRVKSSKLEHLYDDKKISNILGLQISQLSFIGEDGTLSSCNRYAIHQHQNWKYTEEVNENGELIGVYTQSIDETICDNRIILEPELFGYHRFKYEYRIKNTSSKYPLEFAYQGTNEQDGAMAVHPGSTEYICTYSAVKETLEDIYAGAPSEISGLKISQLSFVRPDELRSPCTKFGVHSSQNWVYSEELNDNGETIGVYTLSIDESVCDNKDILENEAIRYYKYEYRIRNISTKYPFEFAYSGTDGQEGAMAVHPGGVEHICTYKALRDNLGNIYDSQSSEIEGLRISLLAFVRPDEMRSPCNKYGTHNPMNWAYSEEENEDGELVGVYTLSIDETICDNPTILNP